MSPNHLNNNLGKKRILEGSKKGIESKQCFFILAIFFHFAKKKMPNNINKGFFEKKTKFTKFRKINKLNHLISILGSNR